MLRVIRPDSTRFSGQVNYRARPDFENPRAPVESAQPHSMDFFGVSLTRSTHDEMLAACRKALSGEGSPLSVVTPNPEILLRARADAKFAATLNAAGLRIPDGIGLYLAAQFADSRLPQWARALAAPWFAARLFFARRALYAAYGERLAGSDLTASILAEASAKGLSVAVVEPLVAEVRTPGDRRKIESQSRIAGILREKYPGLVKLAVLYWDKTNPSAVTAALKADPHALVICTLGSSRQEEVAVALVASCPGVRLALAVGGSLDFECGFVKRAPKFFRAAGLEWLWRLALEPRKRARRIWDAVVRFPLAVLRDGK